MLRFKPLDICKRFPSFSLYSTIPSSNYINTHLTFFLSTPSSPIQSLLLSHSIIITSGNSNNVFIAAKLIAFYASFNKPRSCAKVFDSVINKDVFLWNSIIKSYFSNGDYPEAFDFYLQMRASAIRPNQFTIPMVVASCAELLYLEHGKNIHGFGLKCGLFLGNSAVGSSFVYMYSKCGQLEHASQVFDEILIRDVVAWTALIIGYVQNGETVKSLKCFYEMHRVGGEGERPNFRTIEGGFHACGDLGSLVEGRCLHGLAVKTGLGCSHVVQSSILSMYAKSGTPEEAYLSFSEVVEKDLLSLTSIIGIYARLGLMTECLKLFWRMQFGKTYPDGIVISCMILGFGNTMRVSEGKTFHGLIMRRKYILDHTVHNALLSMYCKFGLVMIAERLFEQMHEWSKDSWNTMVSGYRKAGFNAKCIELFREMQHQCIEPDSDSLVSVVSACSQLGESRLGCSLHGYIIKFLLGENVSVANSLIEMYGKAGKLIMAQRIFGRAKRDVVTWNTLMASYSCRGHFTEAIALFDKMISKNLKPNLATLVTVISACSHVASLEKGERIYQYIQDEGFEFNLSLTTALVDMYAKCGKVDKSRQLFDSIEEKDVIAWNVMISGYGMHGHAKCSLEVFRLMEKSDVKPNEVTFLSLFRACSHAGLVEEGKYLFSRMHIYSLKPTLKHYACMVDLLGRSGNLKEAEALVLSMPTSPDGGVWGSLLTACTIHNEIEMGVRIAKRAIESDPENDGYYIMISNMYNSIGMWEEAERVRKMMKERGVGKRAGCSVV